MDLSEKQKALYLKRFGQKIERLIYAKFKSKDQFLAESGFHKKGLHDILTGKRDARVSTVLKIAIALEAKPEDLLPKDGD